MFLGGCRGGGMESYFCHCLRKINFIKRMTWNLKTQIKWNFPQIMTLYLKTFWFQNNEKPFSGWISEFWSWNIDICSMPLFWDPLLWVSFSLFFISYFIYLESRRLLPQQVRFHPVLSSRVLPAFPPAVQTHSRSVHWRLEMKTTWTVVCVSVLVLSWTGNLSSVNPTFALK